MTDNKMVDAILEQVLQRLSGSTPLQVISNDVPTSNVNLHASSVADTSLGALSQAPLGTVPQAPLGTVSQASLGTVPQAPLATISQNSSGTGCHTSSVTEFIGSTRTGDTIGLAIANVDDQLLEAMQLGTKFRSIGLFSSRSGAGPHIMAADEAVKATNTEVLGIEMPRDTKSGAGTGALIIFGGHDVSDVKRAVQVALETVEHTFGDVYMNDAGHVELQYTARASQALHMAFNAPLGKAFGLIVGAPAAIGVVMSDVAVKAGAVDIVGYSSPNNASFSNEVILQISGDSSAVKQAVKAARSVGLSLLGTMGGIPHNDSPSYIE